MILDLSSYLGILKSILLQRTISSEIPQISTLYTHGIERTIGNEAMHAAADTVARNYISCFISYGEVIWDGVVSFMYPVIDHLYGAVQSARPIARLYHLSLSEEGKYFPGTYLFLAHEAAHGAISTVHEKVCEPSGWWKLLWFNFYNSTCSFPYLSDTQRSQEIFEECVADVLAMYVGGITTSYALSDFAPYSFTQLARLSFVAGYFDDSQILRPLLSKEVRRVLDTIPKGKARDRLVRIMRKAGASTRLFQSNFVPTLQTMYPNEYALKNFWWKELDLGKPLISDLLAEPSLMARILRDKTVFKPSDDVVSRTRTSLSKGNPVEDVEPRTILHAYYHLFRDNNAPPSYSTTLYSLCYNKADS